MLLEWLGVVFDRGSCCLGRLQGRNENRGYTPGIAIAVEVRVLAKLPVLSQSKQEEGRGKGGGKRAPRWKWREDEGAQRGSGRACEN